jgi:glycosyltransferase involved in cell wall biosynthesis
VESVLNQTFRDFEFLIINDGSKDDSLDILKKYEKEDIRIRLISRKNKGLVASLNEGITKAKGEYLARMDSDDVSPPYRLEREVNFLDGHPEIGLVGSNYTIINESGEKLTTTNVFTHPDDLKIAQITCNQYGHGSIMARLDLIRRLSGYDSSVGHVEDYHLWTRLSRITNIANIEEPLYFYRSNSEGITQQNLRLQIQQTFAVRDEAFAHFLTHRSEYKLFHWHPSGSEYRRRKATLFRDLAYLYRKHNRRFHALIMLSAALLLQPRFRKNLRYIKHTLKNVSLDNWEYEFL